MRSVNMDLMNDQNTVRSESVLTFVKELPETARQVGLKAQRKLF